MLITQNKTKRSKLISFDCDINLAKFNHTKEQNLGFFGRIFNQKTFSMILIFYELIFTRCFSQIQSKLWERNYNLKVIFNYTLWFVFKVSRSFTFRRKKCSKLNWSIFLEIHFLTMIYFFWLKPITCWTILLWHCQKT